MRNHFALASLPVENVVFIMLRHHFRHRMLLLGIKFAVYWDVWVGLFGLLRFGILAVVELRFDVSTAPKHASVPSFQRLCVMGFNVTHRVWELRMVPLIIFLQNILQR